MKGIGISTLTWASKPLEETLGLARGLGFEAVDLGILNDWTPWGPRDFRLQFEPLADRLQRALDRERLKVLSINAGFGKEKDPFVQVDEARALAKLARRVGAPAGITLNAGPREATLDQTVARLRPLWEVLQDEGVPLMIETHFNSFTESVASTLELVQALPGLRLTLDASHYLIQGLQPRDWAALVPFVNHSHIRPCGTKGWDTVQVEVADSTPLVQEWLAEMDRAGYRGTYGFEVIEGFAVADAAATTRQFARLVAP